MVRLSVKKGFAFGITSGVITTLGLMVGLSAGTHSKPAVIGGIMTIAIADAFSDALGVHISEESDTTRTTKEIWESTVSTFLAKFIFAMTFVVPVLSAPLTTAIVVSVAWGLSLLGIFSFYIARAQGIKPWKAITEHLFIALVVIVIAHYVGSWIELTFSS